MTKSPNGFIDHAQERTFDGKRYSLVRASFDKRTATEMKKKIMKTGGQVRIYEGIQRNPMGGHEMKKAYYVYMR